MQNKISLPLGAVEQFGRLDVDYASGAAALRDFYAHEVKWEAFDEIIKRRAADFGAENRIKLVEALRQQYAKLPADSPDKAIAEQQISLLSQPNTLAVVTAHQPLVATGVLYYVYKILAAVRLAEELGKRHSDYNFVPVYWLGGEDHDFEEISAVSLFGKKLAWQKGDKGGAVGRMSTASLADFLAELGEVLGQSEPAQAIFATIAAAYTSQKTFADATRQLLQALFGRFGLLMLDADNRELKRLFVPVMENDLTAHDSHRLVGETVWALEQRGYPNQAYVREINLFYFLDNARERIVWEPEAQLYRVLNTDLSFSAEQILAELEANPERFSPNVILRPLYQETVLPNVAYIGGGGEIAYWLERRAQFEHFGVPMPMLVRRPSFLLVDEPTRGRLQKLQLQPLDLMPHYDIVVKNYLQTQSDSLIDAETERQQAAQILQNLQQRVASLDKDIATFLAAQQAQIDNIFVKINEKLTRAAKRKEETQLQQVRKVKDTLFPNEGLQERSQNFLPFYLQQGPQLFDRLAEAIADPLAQEFIILDL